MFSHIAVTLAVHREENNFQHWAFKSIYKVLHFSQLHYLRLMLTPKTLTT